MTDHAVVHDFRYRLNAIEWEEAPYDFNGVHINAWASKDKRFTVEQHPQSPDKFMLTDRGHFAGIYRNLEIAQSKAQRKRNNE